MLSEDEKKKITARLKRIEGQVRGLMRMIDEDKYCIDVMHQIAAVQGGLAEVSKKVLSRHLDTCVRSAMETEDRARRERVLDELGEVFARYGRVEAPRKRK